MGQPSICNLGHLGHAGQMGQITADKWDFPVAAMARRPANITQADVARAIRAAKQAGASEVEVRVANGSTIVIRIAPSTSDATALATNGDIVL